MCLQGISAIENMMGRPHVLNHRSVPAACFTHPEVSFVGLNEEQAQAKADEEGFKARRVPSTLALLSLA